MAYQGSTETGQAVADVVFGTVNPSGKLPVSWPTDADTPTPLGVAGDSSGRTPSPLGDQPKYFDQLPSTSSGTGSGYNPVYSFGFGLSYTTFSVDSLRVSGPKDTNAAVTATFSVTNTGGRSGAYVVPVFVHQQISQVLVAPHRLVGFTRVDLEAGESLTAEVEFPVSRLAVTPGDIDSSVPPEVLSGIYTVEVPTQPQPDELFPASSPPLQADFTLR
jgi:beta-glucosidase